MLDGVFVVYKSIQRDLTADYHQSSNMVKAKAHIATFAHSAVVGFAEILKRSIRIVDESVCALVTRDITHLGKAVVHAYSAVLEPIVFLGLGILGLVSPKSAYERAQQIQEYVLDEKRAVYFDPSETRTMTDNESRFICPIRGITRAVDYLAAAIQSLVMSIFLNKFKEDIQLVFGDLKNAFTHFIYGFKGIYNDDARHEVILGNI